MVLQQCPDLALFGKNSRVQVCLTSRHASSTRAGASTAAYQAGECVWFACDDQQVVVLCTFTLRPGSRSQSHCKGAVQKQSRHVCNLLFMFQTLHAPRRHHGVLDIWMVCAMLNQFEHSKILHTLPARPAHLSCLTCPST